MKVKTVIYPVIAASMLMLSGCASWFTSDNEELPPAELIEFAQEITPEEVWDKSAGDGNGETNNDMGAYLQDGKLYAVDYEGEVYAFNAETGRREWDRELDVGVITGIGGGMGMIYVGAKSGVLYALDAETGEERWHTQLSSEILAPPSGDYGTVVARTSDGRVVGVSADSGAIQWSYQRSVPLLSLRGAGAPVLVDDAVIAGYDNGKLVALSLQDGKVLWEINVAVPRGRTELERLVDIDADPVIINNTIYVVTYQGNLSSIDLYSAQVLWSREMSSTRGLAAIPGDTIYVTDDDNVIWAIQDGSGEELWRQPMLERRQVSAPAVIDDYIVVGDLEGYVHWLDRYDGHFVARQRVSKSPIISQPLVAGSWVYITSADGTITALRAP